jgi:tetratricopeptide (TPR) repeat protein/CHAT domain-containing protein
MGVAKTFVRETVNGERQIMKNNFNLPFAFEFTPCCGQKRKRCPATHAGARSPVGTNAILNASRYKVSIFGVFPAHFLPLTLRCFFMAGLFQLCLCILALAPCRTFAGQDVPADGTASPEAKIVRLNKEVISLYKQGNYREALTRCVEVCETARHDMGDEHPEFGSCISNLALIYETVGNYRQAGPLLEQSLEISRKAFGENDPDFVTSLNNLANFYTTTGKYAEAEALYHKSLRIIRAGAGEESLYFLSGLNNLASLYKAMGNYVEVEPLYRRAAEIVLKISGEDRPAYAIVLNNLAQYYYEAGMYRESETTYLKSLDLSRKVQGEQHPVYARTLNNMGSLYEVMGNYAKAESCYREALSIFNSKSGKDSPDAATALNNLAGLFKTIGDYGKAESYYRQANEIRMEFFGETNPKYAIGLNNLADLFYSMGRFEAAEQMWVIVLEIQHSSLGQKHPDVALTLQNLAALYKSMGRYKESEKLYRQALEIWKPALGDRHPDVALALHNLASLYYIMGDYEAAEPLYLQALEIRTAVLGNDHPDVAATMDSLAALYAATSRRQQALELMKQAQSIDDSLIRNVFSFASESQRMGYVTTLRGEMDAFLSLVFRDLSTSSAAVMDAMDLVLKRKAFLAEVLAAQRDTILSGRYPDLAPALHKLRTLNSQIARKIMAGPGPEGPEAHRELLEKWKAEKENTEVFLAGRIPEIDLERRLADTQRQKVAAALLEGSVLVEFVRFNPFDFKAMRAKGQPQWQPSRYLAFILPAGKPDNIRMIDLGEADAIDTMISDFRIAIRADKSSPRRGAADGGLPHIEAGQKLREALFDPVRKAVDERKRLFIAPDGEIYRLSFGVLPEKEGNIIDNYNISYIDAGRDVLRFGAAPPAMPAAPIVIADPDYDFESGGKESQTGNTVDPARQSRDMTRYASRFDRLAGTRVEGEHIADMLGVKPIEGDFATKPQLENVHSPRVLHIATHGFFLPDQKPASAAKNPQSDLSRSAAADSANPLSRGMENPLLRSGLVLAGANTWLSGKAESPEAANGILTAEDASGLDLLFTDLVVLSACQTGLGDIKVGEGVFGLRRAFLLAGAKTLLMTLWKIPDEETQMLMEGFYRRILEGKPRADALREAQLAVRAVHPEPLFWGAFICQGDPGPLNEATRKDE